MTESKTINAVTVKSGWILQKIAERIVEAGQKSSKNSYVLGPPRYQGYNFYVDVQNCWPHSKLGVKDIGLFTHIHENDYKSLPDHYHKLDHIVHMSRRSHDEFLRRGHKPEKNHVLMPGEIDPAKWPYKKPSILVAQRGEHEGKGYHLMLEAVQKADFGIYDSCDSIMGEFDWTFIGGGWEEVANLLKDKCKANVLCMSDTDIKYPCDYAAMYSSSNYLLIPSKWEGGPMASLEAAACGLQIIAPDVGWWGNELRQDYSFTNGEPRSLVECLESIVEKRVIRRHQVLDLKYANYVKALDSLFDHDRLY